MYMKSWFGEGGGAILRWLRSHTKLPGVDGDTLCTVVRFVNTHQSVGQFKHVVAQADNDKLSILCAFLWDRGGRKERKEGRGGKEERGKEGRREGGRAGGKEWRKGVMLITLRRIQVIQQRKGERVRGWKGGKVRVVRRWEGERYIGPGTNCLEIHLNFFSLFPPILPLYFPQLYLNFPQMYLISSYTSDDLRWECHTCYNEQHLWFTCTRYLLLYCIATENLIINLPGHALITGFAVAS